MCVINQWNSQIKHRWDENWNRFSVNEQTLTLWHSSCFTSKDEMESTAVCRHPSLQTARTHGCHRPQSCMCVCVFMLVLHTVPFKCLDTQLFLIVTKKIEMLLLKWLTFLLTLFKVVKILKGSIIKCTCPSFKSV